MKTIFYMFKIMVKQISRDFMMVMLIVAPFLCGAFFKFGIPLLEKTVLLKIGYGQILVPYYELFSWLMAMICGMLFAFAGGLVILGELDDSIAKYVCVTPAGISGYLSSRILIPGVLSGIGALVVVPVFSLCSVGLIILIVMMISTVLSGIITALLVVAISSNKVEGMAVGKLSGLFGVFYFVPMLIKGNIKYAFSIFPMFHIGEWSLNGGVDKLIIAGILFAVWIFVLYRLFVKKLNR